MGRPADHGIAARTEQTLVTVVAVDAITLVWQLAHHLENLADSLRLTHAMARDHKQVANFGSRQLSTLCNLRRFADRAAHVAELRPSRTSVRG